MNEQFQDKIDAYIQGRMSEAEKKDFERQVAEDPKKQAALQFTQNLKKALTSRGDKLKALRDMEQRYHEEAETTSPHVDVPAADVDEKKHSYRWLWMSGIAAVLVSGFFVLRPLWLTDDVETSPFDVETPRGENETFEPGYIDTLDVVSDTLQVVSDSLMTDE